MNFTSGVFSHGEEFETGMRSDERHLENFGVLIFREFKCEL